MNLETTVAELCSPQCAGRKTGTEQSRNARGVIALELEKIGLEPAGEHRWLQPVPASDGENILAKLPGNGAHADRAILVAAHYDHLGPKYLGADDNAAAVAILIDTAKKLTAEKLGRQIIFAFFDGEEPPNFLTEGMGSMHFAEQPTFPLARIDLMICMDLMGHALGNSSMPAEVRNSVFALGAEKSKGTGGLVDEVAKQVKGVNLRRVASEVIPTLSDYAAFEAANIPYLFLTCGRWQHYHQPSDTPEKLDYAKMDATSKLLTDLVVAASARPVPRYEWLEAGRDDRASLDSLLAIAGALRVAPIVRELEALERALAKNGVLTASERQKIAMMVALVENKLAL